MTAIAQIRRNDQPIYLDYQATTPLAPEAREAMLRWLSMTPLGVPVVPEV